MFVVVATYGSSTRRERLTCVVETIKHFHPSFEAFLSENRNSSRWSEVMCRWIKKEPEVIYSRRDLLSTKSKSI